MEEEKIGLVLTGGGARAAYQVGVLKAISRILPLSITNPFPIVCGTSAGAINGASIAIAAPHFREGVKRLSYIWSNFHVHHVFYSDTLSILSNGARWLAALLLGGFGKQHSYALLNRLPLLRMLRAQLPCEKIERAVSSGALHAFGITLSSYTTGHSITFYEGNAGIKSWRRARRMGVPATVQLKHLMASSAIPFVFEAVRIDDEFYGDGSMRQIAPISPAIHLGASRVLVIGSKDTNEEIPSHPLQPIYPSVAEISGHVLNSIFLDALEVDLERLQRINQTISMIPEKNFEMGGVKLRPVEALFISPSKNLDDIASTYAAKHLPHALRFSLKCIGALRKSGSNLISYLLFEKAYCRELIKLGYLDTFRRQDEVLAFFGVK